MAQGNASGIRAGYAYIELSTINNVNKDLDKILSEIKKFANQTAELAKIPITFAIAGALPTAVMEKTFMEFDDQMRLVSAISGATGKDFERLTEKAKELGRTTSWTAIQVAEGMTVLARIGFDSTQIEEAIPSIMNLARATGNDLPMAAELAGNVMRQFGLEATDMTRIADILAAASNGAAQELFDIGDSFKYAAPVAREFGVTIEDAATYVGTLANFGIKSDQAGTSLRQILLRLADPKFSKILKKNLDIDTTDQQGNLRSLGEVITELNKAMANMPTAKKMSVFKKVFGIYAVTGASSLTKSDFSEVGDEIKNSEGLTERIAKEMDAGLGGAFRLGKSAIEGVALAIGESLAPKLIELSTIIQNATPDVVKWIKINQASIDGYVKIGVKILAVSATLYGLAKAVGYGATAVDLIRKSTIAYWRTLAFITGATKAHSAAVAAQKAVEVAEAAVTKARVALLNAQTVAEMRAAYTSLQLAQSEYIAASSAQKAAFSTAAFRNALASLSAVVTVVAAVGAALYYMGGAAERATKKTQESIDKAKESSSAVAEQFQKADELINRLKDLNSQQSLNNEEMAEAEGIISTLTARYGDLGLSIDKTTGKINGLSDAQKQLKKQLLEAQIIAKQAEVNALTQKGFALKREQDDLTKWWSPSVLKYGVNKWIGGKDETERYAEIKTEMKTNGADKLVANAELDSLKAQLDALNRPNVKEEPSVKPNDVNETPDADEILKDLEKKTLSIFTDAQLKMFDKRKTDALMEVLNAQAAYQDALNGVNTSKNKELQNIFDIYKNSSAKDKSLNWAKYVTIAGSEENARKDLKYRRDYAYGSETEKKKFNDYIESLDAGNANSIEETFNALAEAKKKIDEVDLSIKRDKMEIAMAAYQNAVESGNKEQISIAGRDLEAASSDLQSVLDAQKKAAGEFNTVADSTGTFDAFSAADFSFDWQREEMRSQTNELKKTNEKLQKIEEYINSEDFTNLV